MKTYTLNIAGLKRELPIIKLSYDLSIASFVILGDTKIVKKTAPMIAKKLPEVDFIVTVPTNASLAFSGGTPQDYVVAATAMTVTAANDPFIGLLVALVVKYIFVFIG